MPLGSRKLLADLDGAATDPAAAPLRIRYGAAAANTKRGAWTALVATATEPEEVEGTLGPLSRAVYLAVHPAVMRPSPTPRPTVQELQFESYEVRPRHCKTRPWQQGPAACCWLGVAPTVHSEA